MVFSEALAVIGTNLIGIINSVSAVLPQMIKQKYGRIVTLSGGGASRALTNMTIYSASKGGVVTFSKCLAQELKERDDDIKINIFNPGMLKTNLGTNIEIVSGWKDEDLAKEESELAFEYLGGDIEKSCSKVIPFVLPSCNKNGASFSGVSVMNMIRGGIKFKKILKERENNK
jgi:short-subunit dehydrogenase